MRYVGTGDGGSEIRIDGLGEGKYSICICKPTGVESNIIKLFRRSREAKLRPAAGRWSGWHRNKYVRKHLRPLLLIYSTKVG